MKITAEPRSDQWNADDFVGGPMTFTIAGVKVGVAEQKYDIELVEGQGRAWRPPLTVLRLLIAAWGDDAAAWAGRQVTLYRDESIRFGPEAVGGIRISHMTDLPGNKPFEVKLTSSRGKRTLVHVEPLTKAKTKPADDLATRITKAIDWFGGKNVTRANLEAHVGKPADEWSADDLDELTANRDAILAKVAGDGE